MNSKTFSKEFLKSTDRLDSRLKALIRNQNAKNVHDVRTSIRRIEASFRLLPKNIRKKPTVSNYLAHSKSLFKATSSVRDIDIVEGKLEKFQTTLGIPELLARNAEKRIQLVIGAMKYARILEKTPIPRIKASQIPESKLARRRKKIEKRFEDYLDNETAAMLLNPKPEQIHDFRKNCKMLRYALEIDSNKKKKKLEAALEGIQTILGSVMDDYTTLQYLSETSVGEATMPIASQFSAAKDKEYARFVKLLTREFKRKSSNKITTA